MQIQIETENERVQTQVEQMLQYYLTGLEDGIERMHIVLQPMRDRLGTPLFCCAIHAQLSRGGILEFEETQADLNMAVTRVLDRTVRTLRRRSVPVRLARSA